MSQILLATFFPAVRLHQLGDFFCPSIGPLDTVSLSPNLHRRDKGGRTGVPLVPSACRLQTYRNDCYNISIALRIQEKPALNASSCQGDGGTNMSIPWPC